MRFTESNIKLAEEYLSMIGKIHNIKFDIPVTDQALLLEAANTTFDKINIVFSVSDKVISTAAIVFDAPNLMDKKFHDERHVKARQMVMYYKIIYQGQSLSNTSAIFSLDHSTAHHAKKLIGHFIDTKDKQYYPLIMEFLDRVQ